MMLAEIGGHIDFCDQHEIRGWTNAPSLDVYVNGDCCGQANIGAVRDDGAGEGLDGVHAFNFVFPFPLWMEDRVTLRLSNSRLLVPNRDG